MEIFTEKVTVSKITAAVFVPSGGGAPVHKNRKAYGLAFNVDHVTTYRFDSGKVLACHPGQCIYLPKGANYTVDRTQRSASPGAGVYAVNFLLLDPPAETEPCVVSVRGREEMFSCFQKAEKAWRQKAAGFYEDCFINLYRIIKILKKEGANYTQMDKTLEKLAPALEFINANYTGGDISLGVLAQLCGVSQPYLRKLFHGAFSVPPAVYIRNMRLKYAKELLQSGEYSVTDVAALSGFNDTAYFSREFKKATGVAPNQYKGGF